MYYYESHRDDKPVVDAVLEITNNISDMVVRRYLKCFIADMVGITRR